MLNTVKAAILRYNMIDGVKDVTVALSGGADSVALLWVLLELRHELGITVSAAHLNHCLRGEESDRDEQFVCELCKKLSVPLSVERADVKAFAQENGIGIELAARQVRYEFLERVSSGVIATAHTANDNIETVLHNMARGTGISGICGIPPKRGRLIRPLINVTRDEIERYCQDKGLNFCIDSTNTDQIYTRNFIRHSIVPKMTEVNTNAVKNTAKLCETLRDDADFLKNEAVKALQESKTNEGLCVDGLQALHPAIRSRCVALFYEQCVGKTPEYIHIAQVEELLTLEGRRSVQNDFSAVQKGGILRFVPALKDGSLPEITVDRLPFEYQGVKIYTVNTENFKNLLKFNSLLLNNAADYDKISGVLSMRGRMSGDKIRLPYRNCTKTFKKLFNESKTDELLRDTLSVAADSNGVLWLEGFGIDSRVAVSDTTDTVLVFDTSGCVDEVDNNE